MLPNRPARGVVRWDGNRFTYHPTLAPRSHDRARRRGRGRDRRVRSPGGLPRCRRAVRPSLDLRSRGRHVPGTWDDLGMTIEFANLGGLDPCGEEGASRKPNRTGRGRPRRDGRPRRTRPSRCPRTSSSAYPDMRPAAEDSLDPEEPVGELFTLVDRPSTVGLDEPHSGLSARVAEEGFRVRDLGRGGGGVGTPRYALRLRDPGRAGAAPGA